MTTYRTASPADIIRLREIWNSVVEDKDAAVSQQVFEGVIARYSEPHRHYHNVGHLVELFEGWDKYKDDLRSKRRVALAIFFHDAVYEVGARDNEAKSADLAVAELTKLGYTTQVRNGIANLIRMTATHKAPATDKEGAMMLDLDMKVLGAAPADYDRYAAAIEKEYSKIFSPLAYARGRLSLFVLPTLRQPKIFLTKEFEDQYGASARKNLEREKKTLVARLPKP